MIENRSAHLDASDADAFGSWFGPAWPRETLSPLWLEAPGAFVAAKRRPGFDAASIEALTHLVHRIARGDLPGLKYLVVDFAHGGGAGESTPLDGFEELVTAIAELVIEAPVITVAWARSFMMGTDLDLALHCSMFAAQPEARFSFDGDPMALIGLYATLARKIGFAKAERLFESGETLDAEDMRDLMIVKEVLDAQAGAPPIQSFLRLASRRFNASQAVFRAQRMAASPLERAVSTRIRR